MKRYNITTKDERRNRKVDAFLEEIIGVCKKHGLSISHEEHYGPFEIEVFSADNEKWLRSADDATGEK
jgi:hypothetical protein